MNKNQKMELYRTFLSNNHFHSVMGICIDEILEFIVKNNLKPQMKKDISSDGKITLYFNNSLGDSLKLISYTVAQKKYNERRIDCHRPIKATYTTIEYIKNKIELHYCAWKKGTNENSNVLLREFYPKEMDLSKTSEKEVQQTLELLNNRPRKCINYKTPNELYNEFLLDCCT